MNFGAGRFQLVCAAAFLLTALSLAAHAQTMSFAEAAQKLVAACEKDIDSHCKGVNLGGGKMKACLTKNSDTVSARCKETVAEVFAGVEKRAVARVNVLKVCDIDRRRLCGDIVKGDGQILECMLTAAKGVSAKCNQAITDAGYR